MKKMFTALCFLIMVSAASSAWGHMLWLLADNYHPDIGDTVQIEINWGHHFPKEELNKEGILKRVYALDPSGHTVDLKQVSMSKYELTVKQKGVYPIFAQINSGVYTKTTDGYKRQNKKGLDNALKCVSYDMRAKTVICAGGQRQGVSQEADDLLEIVLLENPGRLKEGDLLPVKVLFQGKPLSREYLYATYVGFSDQSETYAFSTMTNKDGEAKIKLVKKGAWLAKVPYKLPYPDLAECDEYYYCATLTFEVK
ncbi:MAG: DUF4198 domain-containing protein [Deltaproteobacteria bacterium]|nr:DUF4198 domain-containing protein [Deltaproteobacteria bacterium]